MFKLFDKMVNKSYILSSENYKPAKSLTKIKTSQLLVLMTFFVVIKNPMTNILLNLYFGQSGFKVRNQETSETSKSVSIGLRIDTFQYFHHVL